ncbi:MAG TPA: NAD(P)/FAD-dependent oxidoreductase [Frankiaceae bacterium]|nr:NAD(P)/FAD-dependent oxidoreductase [Frankiaceae bacterium]
MTREPLPTHARVAIVGSGFAGLGSAIKLQQEGETDFVVLERADDVGGTWRDNTYPGCACDVPSHLYSFSFAPNPDWSRSFSPQPEIQAYLQRVARESGVLPKTYFGAELLEAAWSEADRRWSLRTVRGSLTAEFLILGSGFLSEPRVPDMPGLGSFGGHVFHSAQWDAGYDLTGKRVGVVGTGASAIQFVPPVAEQAGHLTLFQRTPPWVLSRRDSEIRESSRRAYHRVPLLRQLRRFGVYVLREGYVVGFAKQPKLMALFEKQARRHLAQQISDPELRAKLTPHYRLGCKRVLLSNDYYPALERPNVDVETGRIVEITPAGVLTEATDGSRVEHPLDVLIFGTGFHVTDPPIADRVRGRDGNTLAEHWKNTGMSALHGLTVEGFPNMFMLVGPNTGLGHTSIVFMIEAQLQFVLDALRTMRRQGLATIEPRPEAQRHYNEKIQKSLEGTVWNSGGCASWYLDEHGRNTTLWPTFTFTFRRQLRKVDEKEFTLSR